MEGMGRTSNWTYRGQVPIDFGIAVGRFRFDLAVFVESYNHCIPPFSLVCGRYSPQVSGLWLMIHSIVLSIRMNPHLSQAVSRLRASIC